MRSKKAIDLVDEVQKFASKKSAQITAKKTSDKYKKMRNKKQPFNPKWLADEKSVVYDDDRNLADVS